MEKRVAYLILFATAVLFQNFKTVTINPWSIRENDELSRLDHARELLGKYYKANPVAQTKGLPYFEVHMLNHIQASLPKEYKKKAAKITNAILEESEKYSMDPVFVMAIVATESRFNPKAIGSVGEIGLMQLRPETAAWIAKKENIKWKGRDTLFDPEANIRIGVAYVSFLRDYFDGKASKYLSAYNLGPGKLKKMIGSDLKPKIYSTNVMKNYKKIYENMSAFQNIQTSLWIPKVS